MSHLWWLGLTVRIGLSVSFLFAVDTVAVAPDHIAIAAEDTRPPSETVKGDLPEPVCSYGFDETDSQSDLTMYGVTLTDRGALAVGFGRVGPAKFGRRSPASLLNGEDGWSRVRTRSAGTDDGLVAVASRNGSDTWAVGFTTIGDRIMRRPVAARRDDRRWRHLPIRIGKHESISLTGVAADQGGGVWAVGHGGRGAEVEPVIYRRDDRLWSRFPVPRLSGEAVLTDIVPSAPNESWAVGYQSDGDRTVPLIERWDGTTWRRAEVPVFDSNEVVLTAVSALPAGGIWVVGATWNPDIASHEAAAAWWDGQAWTEVAGRKGGTELLDVVGSPDSDGWAVGTAGQSASATRVCMPARQASSEAAGP